MQECSVCKGKLISVNKVTVKKGEECKYIRFSECLDKALKEKYGKYYICDQVNEDIEVPNVFYIEAFYYDSPEIYGIYEEISDFIDQAYFQEFGNSITRVHITNFLRTRTVYPRRHDKCCRDSEESNE